MTTQTTQQRLEARSIREGDCLVWHGCVNKQGYGLLYVEGKIRTTHRISWTLHNGPIPSHTPMVLHACDNPPCWNIDHLSLGTSADNTHDMLNKGREARGLTHGSRTKPDKRVRGDKHGMARLNSAKVIYIRQECLNGRSYADLAKELSVNEVTISKAARSISWKHITNEGLVT